MYSFTMGPTEYVAHRDGRLLSLADCWQAVEGVAAARVWCGGRLVLDRAGEQSGRRHRVRVAYRQGRHV